MKYKYILTLLSLAILISPSANAKQKLDTKNNQLAFNKLLSSAQKGNISAECAVADLYKSGNGVTANHDEAIKWYKNVVFSPSLKVPAYKNTNNKINLAKLNKQVDAGDVKAQNKLGYLYQNGITVEKDKAKAESLYLKAVAQNCPEAINNLAVLYMSDVNNLNKYSQVLPLLQNAATLGNGDAIANLGYLYERGIAVPQDYKKAAELFLQAAAHNNAAAEYNLGYLYQRGLGVEKDLDKSELLYTKAKLNQNTDYVSSIGFMSKIEPSAEYTHLVNSDNRISSKKDGRS